MRDDPDREELAKLIHIAGVEYVWDDRHGDGASARDLSEYIAEKVLEWFHQQEPKVRSSATTRWKKRALAAEAKLREIEKSLKGGSSG